MPHAEAVPVSVCSLAHNFLYAVMHLSTCVGRQGSFRARDLLRIMLVRDLVETYGHHHAAFRLDKLATLAALVYDYRQLVRTQSRLARALDDENTITAWCGVFVDEYCGGPATTELGGAGSQARFRVPAARTPGFRDSLKRECLETLAWLRRRVSSRAGSRHTLAKSVADHLANPVSALLAHRRSRRRSLPSAGTRQDSDTITVTLDVAYCRLMLAVTLTHGQGCRDCSKRFSFRRPLSGLLRPLAQTTASHCSGVIYRVRASSPPCLFMPVLERSSGPWPVSAPDQHLVCTCRSSGWHRR